MKNSTLARRLMFMSIIAELIYFLLITVIFVARPGFYIDILSSVVSFDKSALPQYTRDMTLTVYVFGSIIAFFILWVATKLVLDSDKNPLFIGIIDFGMMVGTAVLSEYSLSDSLTRAELANPDNNAIITFSRANNFVMEHCLWISTGAYIFMLMAYAVRRQKHADFM